MILRRNFGAITLISYILFAFVFGYAVLKTINISTSRDELWYSYYGFCTLKSKCENFYLTEYDYHKLLFTPISTIFYGLVGQISDNQHLYRTFNFVALALAVWFFYFYALRAQIKNIFLSTISIFLGISAVCVFVPGFEKLMFHARPDAISLIIQSIGLYFLILSMDRNYEYQSKLIHYATISFLISASIYWTAALTSIPFLGYCAFKLIQIRALFRIEKSPGLLLTYFFVFIQLIYYIINFTQFTNAMTLPAIIESGNLSFSLMDILNYPLKDLVFIVGTLMFAFITLYKYNSDNGVSSQSIVFVLILFSLSVLILVLRDFALRHIYAVTFMWFILSIIILQKYVNTSFNLSVIFISVFLIFIEQRNTFIGDTPISDFTSGEPILISFEHRKIFNNFIPIEAFLFLNFDTDQETACKKLPASYYFYLSESNYNRLRSYLEYLSCMSHITGLREHHINNEPYFIGVVERS